RVGGRAPRGLEAIPGSGVRASCGELTDMETVPGEVMREVAGQTGARTSARERRHWVRPEPRVIQEPSQLHVEKPAEVRMRLQRRAPANLRHHFLRAAVRFTVLLVRTWRRLGRCGSWCVRCATTRWSVTAWPGGWRRWCRRGSSMAGRTPP